MPENTNSRYRWYMLGLIAITSTLVSAIPFSCLPVLFKEMSQDLGLSLVQIGSVWGTVSLAGVFVSLIAGLLGDRFGVRMVVGLACVAAGVFGAARGFSTSFLMLSATVFLHGIVRSVIPINITKTIGVWFRGKNLGMANGVGAMGMGLGLMLGPMISATIMSPLLGGWRNVLFLYGSISALVGVFWFVFARSPGQSGSGEAALKTDIVPFRQAISHVVRIKTLWLLAITLMLRMGCVQGITGYLPLYLQDVRGWEGASADGTLSLFYAVSTLCVIPLATLSDRLGSRKMILVPGLVAAAVCFGLLPVVNSTLVWTFMVITGIFMDSFMAIIVTTFLETKGVEPRYAGTAMGLVFTISQLGGVFSPPIGNSLADINPAFPFIFWAALNVIGLFTLAGVKETGRRRLRLPEEEPITSE